jgi:dipeptidyl aminopeptidase/acylaminoacyl peptidase
MYGRYAVHPVLQRSMIKKLSCIPVVAVLLGAWPATAAKVTIDDLMRLRSLSEVRISPDGKQVAYVVSTPSFETAAHEAVLYVVPSIGGTPLRLTHITRIFNRPVPAPALRWSPDSALLSFIGFVDRVPQVMALSSAGGEAWVLTSVKEGVTNYEWAPDGKRFAFLAPDPPSPEEEQHRKDKCYVIHVDRNERFPRLWVQDARGGTPKAISPANQFVIDFNWAPDGQAVVYSASNESGLMRGTEHRSTPSQPRAESHARWSPDPERTAQHSIRPMAAGSHSSPPAGTRA